MEKEAEKNAAAPAELPSLEQLGMVISVKDDNNELWVEFNPLETTRELTINQFAMLVFEAGYRPEDYPLISANVAVLLDAVRRKQPQLACISIPQDARVDVFLSSNKLLAGVVLYGAEGLGQPISRDALDQALKKAKVSHGLIEEVFDDLLSQERAEALRNTSDVYCTVIAYGEGHEHGKDAVLEVLVDDASDRRPIEDDQGRVHYLEKGDFPYLDEGESLLRRYPPTKGKPGMSVQGKTIRAKDGKDLQFRLKDASVKPSDDDENLLVAAVAGMPVLYDKGAQIEDVLKIDNVDLSTGHVRYRGSVEIKGDVRDGMQVVATGDIKIAGGVDAAFIKAGGHIEVIGGAIGHQDAEYLTEKAALKAGYSIKARFAHEAIMEAGHEIIISNQVMHSQLTSGSFIQVQGKGQVVGGKMKAVDYVEVSTSGAVAYSETLFEVGECADLQTQYTALLALLNKIDDKKYNLIELARKVRKKGREEIAKMKGQLVAAKEKIQLEARELNTSLTTVEDQLKRFYAAKVVVSRRAYPGTKVVLAGSEFEVSRELDKVTFYLQDGQVQTRQ
ncbi:DUF342 domain-containing protein [Marinospirillum insulare]|uniref:Flagellar Assembly Protein A N-terminal region domain-containing protein n=1 Tax=Marinospirillum insulare TaxID=217169 RepID=A0ABQ6A0F6_9GAMM|nr:FapA family protein [Marinospirillum insulare]GLR63614.1 hypothetical protein GCM10007878_10490 [Marinospirillum insulare]